MNKKLFIVLMSNYGAVISIGFFTPIYALYIVKLGGTAADVGIATAIYYVVGGVLMLLLSKAMNKKNARPMYYVLGNLIEAVSSIMFIFAGSVAGFYIVQLVHALATALRVPTQRALYAEYEDKGREGSEWSLMEGGDFIILGISAALGGATVFFMSFEAVFILMAIIQSLTTLYTLKLLRRN